MSDLYTSARTRKRSAMFSHVSEAAASPCPIDSTSLPPSHPKPKRETLPQTRQKGKPEERKLTWKNSPTLSFFAPPLRNFFGSSWLLSLSASISRLISGVIGVAGKLNHCAPAVWGCFCSRARAPQEEDKRVSFYLDRDEKRSPRVRRR